MVDKFVKLKVFKNKSNGQFYVVIPKKELKKNPKFIQVKKRGVFK